MLYFRIKFRLRRSLKNNFYLIWHQNVQTAMKSGHIRHLHSNAGKRHFDLTPKNFSLRLDFETGRMTYARASNEKKNPEQMNSLSHTLCDVVHT